jgi:hypothetical protein
MSCEALVINGEEYVKKNSVKPSGNIRIVILQRGHVAVGYFSKDGDQCKLEQAAFIRNWGTTKGLGEIAYGGPTSKTILDRCPVLNFHELTIITTVDCSEEKWVSKLS